MSRNEKLSAILKMLLADKLTIINEYMVHSKICESSGNSKLYNAVKKQAMHKILFADWLIERITLFDDSSNLSEWNTLMNRKNELNRIKNNKYAWPVTFDFHGTLMDLLPDNPGNTSNNSLYNEFETGHRNTDWNITQPGKSEHNRLKNYRFNQTKCYIN